MMYLKTEKLAKVNDLFLREEQKLIECYQNTLNKLNVEALAINSVNSTEIRILLFSCDDSFNSKKSIDEGEPFYECKASGKDLINKLQELTTQEYSRTLNYITKQVDFNQSDLLKIDDVWLELSIDLRLKTNVWNNKFDPYLVKK